jgi:ketosteroid isomerase-like protein
MPPGNAEVVRRGFDLWARGDIEAVTELLHPDIEWYVTDVFVEAQVHRGRDRVAGFIQEFAAAWDGFRIDLDETTVHGDIVVASGRFAGRAPASGIEVEATRTWVIEVRDGMIWRWRSYVSREQALETLRLRE